MKTRQTRPPAPLGALPPNPRDLRGMAGQKNDKKKAWSVIRSRHRGSFSRPGLAIPCQGASQQSPTPFRQAETIYIVQAGRRKTSQTRPPAPRLHTRSKPHPFTCRF
jgi:hypothetical protein